MFNHQLHAALWSGQHLTSGEIKSYESYYWEQPLTERSVFFGRTHHREEKLNQDLSTHLSLTSLETVHACIQHKIIFVIKIIKVTSFHGNDISYSAVIHGLTLCIILAKLKSWGFNATQVFLLCWKCARLFTCLQSLSFKACTLPDHFIHCNKKRKNSSMSQKYASANRLWKAK